MSYGFSELNTGLFAMNTLRNMSSATPVFGGTSFNTSIFGMGGMTMPMMPMMTSMPMSFNFSMPMMPTFNFGNMFSQMMTAPQTSAPRYNYSSFGTNVRSSQVSLTSNRAQNAVAVAKSQIGVREIGTSNNGADVNKYRNGKADGSAWCAYFTSWCYGKGQNSNNSDTFGFTGNSQEVRRRAQQAGYYQTKNSGYTPKVGDLAIWKYTESTGHIGIISKVNNDGTFQVIEGNCDNAVQEVTRSYRTENLHGFVQMNEWLEA